jgi:hypothetical protein
MAAKRLSLPTGSAIAVTAAAAAWLTGGALTFTSSDPGATRLGILPSPWWLLLWLVAMLAALMVWRRARRFSLLILSVVIALPWLPVAPPAAALIWVGRCATGCGRCSPSG